MFDLCQSFVSYFLFFPAMVFAILTEDELPINLYQLTGLESAISELHTYFWQPKMCKLSMWACKYLFKQHLSR